MREITYDVFVAEQKNCFKLTLSNSTSYQLHLLNECSFKGEIGNDKVLKCEDIFVPGCTYLHG